MPTFALAISAAALFAFSAAAFSQTVQVGPRGIEADGLHQGRSAARAECRELRRACLHQGQLGEQGQGNCGRYRERCGLE
jgi:hypothetical protein